MIVNKRDQRSMLSLSRSLFSQKSSIIDAWRQGHKYASIRTFSLARTSLTGTKVIQKA